MANMTSASELIGDYRLMEEIAAGLFMAESRHSRKPATVKLLGRIDRFAEVARKLTQLQHEHLVSIQDAGEENGECYLVMERLKGETLLARLKREHRLLLKEALRIGRETASGLAFGHAHGLLHRDICPENIWLEPSGRVRLLGLGATQDDGTLLGRLDGPGTPGYLSPEQAAGEATTPASDLFGLGCVLFRMLTGEQPFVGDQPQALIRAVVFDHPKSAREINPEISEALDELIARLLSKLPADRPVSAQEVEQRLMDWIDPLAPKPVLLPPKLPEAIVYPASKRILEELSAAKSMPPMPSEPNRPLPAQRRLAFPLASLGRFKRWLPDLIAAVLLLAGAVSLYLWWRASNEPPQAPGIILNQSKQ
jgi:eukaryotic-like serine/threonine-protein kinase